MDLSAEAAKYEPKPLVVADLPPNHIGGLTYTGGTTGKPKGVIGTTGNIASMTSIQLAEWEWPEHPRFLMCTPLSHAGAAFFTPTVVKGGEMVVLAKFDPAEVLKTIEEQRITATMLVPSMLYALMDHPDSHTRDLSSLETVYYGASAINPVRLAEAIRRFGPIFAQYYGQSEAPMVITYLAKGDHDEKRLTSCGRPTLFARVALLGEDGKPVPQGEPGEICVSGPLLAGGYWNLPEATAETFKDGWLHTGDMAREDEDGFYFIVDRVKDMIVTGGFNVFPREVEDVVAEHAAVAQVCVVGSARREVGRGRHRGGGAACRRGPRRRRDRGHDRRDPGGGQGPQGLGAVAQAGGGRRFAAVDRAGQAGQEGRPGAVLGRRQPRRRLSSPARP